VLAGIQVPDADMAEFLEHLRATGYEFWDESGNAAYRLFLSAS